MSARHACARNLCCAPTVGSPAVNPEHLIASWSLLGPSEDFARCDSHVRSPAGDLCGKSGIRTHERRIHASGCFPSSCTRPLCDLTSVRTVPIPGLEPGRSLEHACLRGARLPVPARRASLERVNARAARMRRGVGRTPKGRGRSRLLIAPGAGVQVEWPLAWQDTAAPPKRACRATLISLQSRRPPRFESRGRRKDGELRSKTLVSHRLPDGPRLFPGALLAETQALRWCS
jgi:hypothetical protein